MGKREMARLLSSLSQQYLAGIISWNEYNSSIDTLLKEQRSQ